MFSLKNLVVFGVCLLTLPAVVLAETEEESTVKKQAAPYELEKMVVTPGRGSAQEVLKVPQSVVAIDDRQINDTVRTSAADVVQTIPGVNLAPSGGAGDTSNRNSDYWNSGFTIRGLGAQRALVLTDGIRQSGQGIGYGGGNLSLYDLSALERIEVMKGPGSVLYGTDAFGGVIQLFTHQPEERDSFGWGGRARTSFDGSRNVMTQGGFVDVGDEKWGLVLGGSYADAHNPTLPDNLKPQGGNFTKQSGNMNFVYRPTQNSQLKIIADVVEARDIEIFDSSSAGLGSFYFKIPFYQRSMYGAEYSQQDVSEHVESWSVGLYQQMLKRQFKHATPDFSAISPPFTDVVTTQDTVRTTELQPQIVFDFAPHTLTVGADFGFDTTYLPENSSLSGYVLKADASQKRAGVYAQDRWELNDKNFLTLGARYDRFSLDDHLGSSDRDNDGFSGSVGYTHMIDPQTSVYATLATGLRSPDLDERYQNTTINFFTTAVTVQGNPDLVPERSYSLDLGMKKESALGDFEVGGYYNRINDFIGPVLISHTALGGGLFSDVQQRQNIGTVDVYGFEAGWQTSRTGHWRNYLNVARTWSDQPANVALANYQFNYGFGYAFKGISPFSKITPQWMGRFVAGSEDTVNHVKFAPFHEADAQVAFEWEGSALRTTQLVVGVKNVFDTLYHQPFFDQPQPGRGVFASLQVDF